MKYLKMKKMFALNKLKMLFKNLGEHVAIILSAKNPCYAESNRKILDFSARESVDFYEGNAFCILSFLGALRKDLEKKWQKIWENI